MHEIFFSLSPLDRVTFFCRLYLGQPSRMPRTIVSFLGSTFVVDHPKDLLPEDILIGSMAVHHLAWETPDLAKALVDCVAGHDVNLVATKVNRVRRKRVKDRQAHHKQDFDVVLREVEQAPEPKRQKMIEFTSRELKARDKSMTKIGHGQQRDLDEEVMRRIAPYQLHDPGVGSGTQSAFK